VTITYLAACADPNLFGPWFEGESWRNWRVIDKAIFGLPLDDDELPIFRELTGRLDVPTEPIRETWLAFGRRTAKTLKAASYGTYLATIGAEAYGYRERLAPGERGVVQILAVDRAQAEVCMEYVRSFFEQPMLEAMIKRETADSIELSNSITIEITTNDRRRVRGRTVIAGIFDEVAHWRSENTVSPDEDVYQSVKPAMVTIPNSLLIGISSPHARRGLLWRKVNEFYGKPGRTLVARASTWVMNPTLARDHPDIEEAYASDPTWADAEFGAQFRVDVESYASREVVEAATDWNVHERPPREGVRYLGFVDPSGGARDSFVAAIAHAEGEIGILDCVKEFRPPFSPERVIDECADLFRRYRVSKITGDQYALGWVQEPFRRVGLDYKAADPKNAIYISFLPLLNSGRSRLLGNRRLINQLLALERTTSRGAGRDTIDHPRGGYDDLINAAAGALLLATAKPKQAVIGCQDGSFLYPDGQGNWVRRWGDERDKPLRIRQVTVDGKTGKTIREEVRELQRDPKFFMGGCRPTGKAQRDLATGGRRR
jgi:hypothetical protein